jgi:hypothetical protein
VAVVSNGRLDVVAVNPLGRAVFSSLLDGPDRPPNLARFCFLDPGSAQFYPDWESIADATVAILRTEAGRDPYNRALTDLVGELATRSDAFRTRWAAHDVRLHLTGAKRLHHPVVGDLDLVFNTMALPADPGLTLAVYTADPASGSAEKLALLSSWTATDVRPRPGAAAGTA